MTFGMICGILIMDFYALEKGAFGKEINMIYLDNSATTKPCREAVEAMNQALTEDFFNPSAIYAPAMKAGRIMDDARTVIAKALGGSDLKVYFTSGGTEGDNIALLGTARLLRGKGHFITTRVEHPAILETCAELERLGHEVTYVGVDKYGVVDVEELVASVKKNTALVSVMQVNNEVGAIMPIAEIAKRVKEKNPQTLIHVDGVQGFLRMPLNMKKDGVDFYSLSGHKIHGPKGVGALVMQKNVRLSNINFGGGQEQNLRSGTENLPGIAGLGAAVRAYQKRENPASHMMECKIALRDGLKEAIPECVINGEIPGAPHILNVTFPVKGEVLLHALEGKGVMCSTGSACASHKKSASHVLTAMGISDSEIDGALRFSLCPDNTVEEMAEVVKIAKENVEILKKFVRR